MARNTRDGGRMNDQLSVRVPGRVYKAITIEAWRRGVSTGEVVRELIQTNIIDKCIEQHAVGSRG